MSRGAGFSSHSAKLLGVRGEGPVGPAVDNYSMRVLQAVGDQRCGSWGLSRVSGGDAVSSRLRLMKRETGRLLLASPRHGAGASPELGMGGG